MKRTIAVTNQQCLLELTKVKFEPECYEIAPSLPFHIRYKNILDAKQFSPADS